MSENLCIPYIRLPRSLLRDPLWQDLPLAYQNVFIVLVEKVCFKHQRFDDHGVLIDLMPGQICISERELLKFCNKYVTRNDIQRSIKKFILFDFVSQEVRHKKNILTIIHKDTYDLIMKQSEPISEPNLSQTRAKLEPERKKEKKEKKEEYINPSASPSENKIFSLNEGENNKMQHNIYYQETNNEENDTNQTKIKENKTNSKQKKSKTSFQAEEFRKSLIKRRENISTSEKNHSELVEKLGIEFTEKCYDHLSEWKQSKSLNNCKSVDSHTDFYRIKKWVIEALKKENSSHKNSPSQVEENRKFAESVENMVSHFYKISALSKEVVFSPITGQSVGECLNYTANGFKDRLKYLLKKFEFHPQVILGR